MKIIIKETGKRVSSKKLIQKSLDDLNTTHISIKEIIDRKILSKTDLKKFITAGFLKELKFKNKNYIERKSLFEIINKK